MSLKYDKHENGVFRDFVFWVLFGGVRDDPLWGDPFGTLLATSDPPLADVGDRFGYTLGPFWCLCGYPPTMGGFGVPSISGML